LTFKKQFFATEELAN